MKISINVLSETSVNKAISKLEEYAESLDRKANEMCEKLAKIGYDVAAQIMGEHIYTGETIGSLEVVQQGPSQYVLRAGSTALLFFEFGAGISGGGHPLAGQFGMGPGTYPGQTHAFDPNGWWYPTDDATLIVYIDKEGQGWGHSRGNPPHMPMYNASQQIRTDLLKTAKEVFKT